MPGKRHIFSLLTFICISLSAFSQTKTITGKIISGADSLPLIGANVYIKGTTVGTTADFDGNFTLQVSDADTLVFSFVGMQPVERFVGSKSFFDVVLDEEAFKVDEVVVTALGISRQSKSLGYSVEKIDSKDIVKGNDRSFLNSLQGKVAGVNISSSSGSPGSSSRILIRGISSLSGSNQPLFIVDGVPVDNSFSGSTSINGGTDFGNGANDIPAEDIESITVLKGSAGTSLYGSRAANGVVIITTKKGSYKTKPTITVSSNVTLEEPLRLIKYQNEFGQGINGDFVNYENLSWGPAFDGKTRLWGYMVDSAYRVKPYEALPNNVREFFDVGVQYNNSISVSGGAEDVSYYLSYSNIFADGIFPTDADMYSRNSISIRSEQKISDKIKTSVSVNYINKRNRYVPTGQGSQSVYSQIMQTPRDISLLEIADINYEFNNINNFYSNYTVNPYYLLKRNYSKNSEDRIFGNFNLEYQIIEGLKFQARLGHDMSFGLSNIFRDVIIPEGNNELTAIYEPGMIKEDNTKSQIKNYDFLFTYEKQFADKFNVQFLAGGNFYERSYKVNSDRANMLTIVGIDNLRNTNQPVSVVPYESLKRLVGVYANLDLSYRSMLFLTFTGRNDWSSTLAPGNNSYFYPGANAGFVFTELLPSVQKILSYGKVRIGYAQTGQDAPVYRQSNTYRKGFISDGYGGLLFPFSGVDGYELDKLLGNPDLKPESTGEYEIGTDLRFFKNRFSIDFTYYKSVVTDLIWDAQISPTSGFTHKTINLGRIENSGIEALVSVIPVKFKRVEWTVSFNYSQNDNVLVSLNESTEKVVLTGIGVSGGQQINYVAKPGKPVGVFEARTILKDEQGRIVVDNQGIPRSTEELVEYGDGNYDYMLGINNEITVFGVTLSASFDIRHGGIMYSQTKDISGWAGTSPETLYNNRLPFIVPNSVIETGRDNNGNPIYEENTKPISPDHLIDFWDNGGYESDGFALINKSFVKLREVSVSYDLPSKLLTKLPIKGVSLNVVGKNLYLWTPDGQYYIDPEVSTFGNDLLSNFGEYGATPTIRSVSFGIRIVL